jgi:hypothetical protein
MEKQKVNCHCTTLQKIAMKMDCETLPHPPLDTLNYERIIEKILIFLNDIRPRSEQKCNWFQFRPRKWFSIIGRIEIRPPLAPKTSIFNRGYAQVWVESTILLWEKILPF